jgi:2'-5' RNA ligase
MTPAARTTVRTFVAVALPDRLRAELMSAAGALGPSLPQVRFVRRPENLHVTLKFLGPVEPARLDELSRALADEVGPLGGFAADVAGLGAFPSAARARVIWAGVADPDRRLAAVAGAVEKAAARLGFVVPEMAPDEDEARPFRGHVTVGRCKRDVDARGALAPWRERRLGAFPVTEVHVYESQRGADGSRYVLRGQAALARA